MTIYPLYNSNNMRYFLLIIILLSGCSSLPKAENIYINVENSYLKLSNDFNTYDSKELLQAKGITGVDPASIKAIGFVNKIDDANIVLNSSDHLMGMITKKALSVEDKIENDINVVYENLLDVINSGDAYLIEGNNRKSVGNKIIERSIVQLVDLNQKPLLILQKTITDANRENIYVLLLGCNPQCFIENEKIISNIENTWKVEINE